MATKSPGDGPTPKPTFVFKGAVRKLGAATMKNVPVDERVAIVRVEQVIEAPPNLARYGGQDITVQLGGRAKVAVGDELIFHTSGWIFGDSVAVRSLRQEPVKKTHAALLAPGVDPVQQKHTREVQHRLESADLVVSGKVTAVRLPAGTEHIGGTRGAGDPAPTNPVSEHDPKWREAVVSLADVHKGSHAADTVTVLFPASRDVRWYKAPKFQPGQQGYFLLHKTKLPGEEQAEVRARGGPEAPAKEVEVYTALHPADFHPVSEHGPVEALLEAYTREPKKGKG